MPGAAAFGISLSSSVGGRVVARTTNGVSQDIVGGIDAGHPRGEPLALVIIAARAIWMVFAREFAPAPFDFLAGRIVAHVQDLVGIATERRTRHDSEATTGARGGAGASWPMCEVGPKGIVQQMRLPHEPPIDPMLAKAAATLPEGDTWLYEPKWDGFRAIVFRDGDEVYIQSRDGKPLDRYFPELAEPLRRNLPARCILDGEVVIAGSEGLDFDSLLLRIHPAASRVAMLADKTPASFVAWDVLALDDRSLMQIPQSDRRERLESALANAQPPVHLTPVTRDRDVASDWFSRFEGAGLDGVVAKDENAVYEPGKRRMLKIKHARTADCVVAGFRWHKKGPGTHIGSLILGLYDSDEVLHHVGVTSSFKWPVRAELADELAPLREGALDGHPWQEWAAWSTDRAEAGQRMPGATSRWNSGKDLSWEPLRIERACEVAYDHLQRDRFRHATTFRRWRPDKSPLNCRYDQLETTAPFELQDIFAYG